MLEEYFSSMLNPSLIDSTVSVQNYDDMSEDQQFDVIERALYGDLKGIIEVTPKDMELYNRRKNMSRTGYVSQAESEAFRRKWEAEHPAEMEEHRQKMAALNLNASSTFSSGPMDPSIDYQSNTLNNYEPYSQVVNNNNLNVGYTPQNYYSNPYGGGGYNPYMASPVAYNQGYYTSMYNPYGYNYYGYNQAPPISNCFEDPISKFAWSKVDQMSQMYHSGQLNYPYGGYGYYQPRQMTEEILANPEVTDNKLQTTDPIMRQHLKMESAKNFFRQDIYLPAVEEPKPTNNVYVNVPIEKPTMYSGYYSSYYSMSPLDRALTTLPPYAQTAEYQTAAREYAQNQQNMMDEIGRVIFQYGNLGDYDETIKSIKEQEIESIRDQYKANLMVDANLPIKDRIENQEKRRKMEEYGQRAMYYAAMYASGNYIRIDQFKDLYKNIMNAGLQSSPDFQLQSKYINPNQTFVEYLDGFNRYSAEKNIREFAANARKAYMGGYDRENYRRSIVTDNPNEANSMIGFKNVYDPIKRQMNQVVTPYEGLADKYAAKRAAYIERAGMYRGGTGTNV